MTKYSLETKLSAVTDYLNNVESFKDIAQKHCVDMTMLKKWVAKFQRHGLAGLQKTYTNYSVEFKMDVLKFINEMGASIAEATTVFNISSSSTVWKWKHLFETQGIDALQPKEKGRPPMKKKPGENQQVEGSEEALKAEIERLRMENAYLKKLHALIQEKEKSQNKTKRK
ncbi:IS3 family transposase ISBth10 [Bacillus rhizoplanae]|uniref:IS3 family transposase ISBth10 n=1 Tax=Bacillus rhizoplanae TaxID=2880966 RepID=A0ABN7ZZB0_9BACI|nr:IS3 family transposase ISBth10 [Bacillus rhizoplanae]